MATYKGVGFDNTNGRVRTGTSSDDISFDAQITATDGVAVTGEVSTTTLTTTGDASIGGDLTVAGDIISRGTVDLVVQDNFIDLNAGNTSTTALSSGFTFSLNRNSSFTASTVTTFVAGVASTSNPTFTATDAGSSSLLAAGDVVFIAGAAEGSNDGLYVVNAVDQSSFPQVVTIKGVGTVATNGNTPWAQTQFTADTGDTASAYKVDIKVIAIADGTNFPDAGGSAQAKGTTLEIYVAGATESDFTGNGDYSELGAASSLQTAYDTGNTITTASSTDIALTLASGDFTVDSGSINFGGSSALTAFNLDTSGAITLDSSADAISLDGAAASNFTVAGANLTLATTTSGTVAVTSAGTLDLDGVAVNIDSSGAMDITAADGQTLSVNHGGGSALAINATGQIDLTGESGSAVNIGSTAAALSLSTTTSGELDITSAGLIDMNAAANLDIDVTGTFDMLSSGAFSIDGTGSSNVTVTSGNLSLETDTSGTLILNSAGSVDINATNDATIDAGGSVSLDGADNSNFTLAANDVGNKTLTISSTNSGGGNGLLDVDADGDITIDAGGVLSLDSGAASNFTTSAGALTLDGASGVLIVGNSSEVDITTSGALDLNSGAGTWTPSTLAIDPTSTFDLDAAGAITIDGASFTLGGDSDTATVSINASGTADNAVELVAGAGGVQIAAEGSNKAALLSADRPQLARNFNVNESVSVGDVLYIMYDSETRVAKTDADAASTAYFGGVALSAQGSVGSSAVVCLMGVVPTTCTDTFATADVGKPVYLSTTAGSITKTPPSGTGDVVFQVGICVSGSGTTWDILIQPQYIMEIG